MAESSPVEGTTPPVGGSTRTPAESPAEFELLRYDCTKPDKPGEHGEAFVEVMTDHPPIPSEALPVLKRHVSGLSAPEGIAASWWHRSGPAWDAVVDLHKAGEHDTATLLARLLAWCDQSSGRRAEPFVFEIRESAHV